MNEQMVQRIRQCPALPSLPTIAMQILELAQKADVDIAEIARIISKDSALAGKILRTVNSSFYGRSHNVSTISHALVILGLQSVKTLVLGFSLVTNLTKNKARGFKHVTYWKHSIYSATAARSIASKVNIVQQEEAFLAALLMDVGMLVFDQVLGEPYGEVHATLKSHRELAAAEQEAFGMTHPEAAGILAEEWKLPPLLSTPVVAHHTPQAVADPMLRKLAEAVGFGSACADVFVDENAAGAIAEVRRIGKQQYNFTDADCDALLADIGARTKEVAGLFEINIGVAGDYEAILRKANEALVELTLRSQHQATTLVEQNVALKKQATTDVLTGLANRACFDQFLADRFAHAAKTGEPLSLLLLDVDKFKSVNDKHGHPAGDKVLKVLGRLLATAARPLDLAARFGGEELCLVLPGTNRTVASAIAETVRRAIAARPIDIPGGALPITASIGVACLEPPASPLKSPAHLLKAADLAVYSAKNGGRNCVRVFSCPAAKPAA